MSYFLAFLLIFNCLFSHGTMWGMQQSTLSSVKIERYEELRTKRRTRHGLHPRHPLKCSVTHIALNLVTVAVIGILTLGARELLWGQEKFEIIIS